MKESFRIEHSDTADRNPPLSDYLRSANLAITDIDPSFSLTAHLAHYPDTSLVMLSTPPVTGTWKRDDASRARTLLLFARQGELSVTSEAPVIRRGRTAILVPPGDAPVEIRATRAKNELIYISAGAHVVPTAAASLSHDIDADPLAWSLVAPLYGFVRALCTTPQPPLGGPDFLAPAVASVVQALASTAFRGITPMESVVYRAKAFIEENHRNPLLNARSVSEHLRVSQRTLQAAFAAEGLTVREELRRARTETALRLMQTHPSMRQAHRASLAGFASQSALYRALQASRTTRRESSEG